MISKKEKERKSKRENKRKKQTLKDNLQLLTLALPTIILLLVFAYWPMFGVILAFKNYKVPKGILEAHGRGEKF